MAWRREGVGVMGSLDCNEYENMMQRRGQDYSLGHRIMYETPVRLLTGHKRNILDVGFGIGWGLDQMVKADIISSYVGYEPCLASFNYVKGRYRDRGNVALKHAPFAAHGVKYDHVFCIEVAEHVPMDGHAKFIEGLRESTGGTLWFSSPDVRRHRSEGVRTPDDWKRLLCQAGFSDALILAEQWTTLLVAQ
jgi:2-polyprenyl-3-methyl-5-hydroxy-6-metoxy-1,4-benzoquinol methylase